MRIYGVECAEDKDWNCFGFFFVFILLKILMIGKIFLQPSNFWNSTKTNLYYENFPPDYRSF